MAAFGGPRKAVPTAGGKRGKTTKVFFPLLTPQTFLRTRLPSVARLNARGPQGRLLLQEHILDRSGAFRSANQAPCTVWPRTVMRGGLRKVNSGSNSLPKAARRTEPSPRNPHFAARPKEVAAQRRVWGVKRGKGTIGALSPLVSAGRARHSSAVDTVHSGRRTAATHRLRRQAAHPLLRVKKKAPNRSSKPCCIQCVC